MALIRCSECGKEISDKAAACVHCGCPISASLPNTSESAAFKMTVEDLFNTRPAVISVDFHAVLSGADNERTRQRVFVKELGQNVEFSVPNSIQVGQAIKLELTNASYSSILFKVASVSRVPAFQSAPATPVSKTNTKTYDEIKMIIKNYEPNWVVQFLNSRRFYTLIILYFGLIITMFFEDGLYMASVTAAALAPFFLPMLIARFTYPLHHIKKYFKKNNIEEAIRNDTGYMNVAICAYNAMPGKKMLAYIKGLNVEAGQKIEQQLAASKKK